MQVWIIGIEEDSHSMLLGDTLRFRCGVNDFKYLKSKDKMYYMIYVSQAKKPCDAPELEQLLQISRVWNTTKSLTGLLIYRYSSEGKSGHFIQMLEGEKAEVLTLFDKIKIDKRHHTVLTLNDGNIENRMFSEWAMGFKNIGDETLAGLPGYARLGESTFNPSTFQQSNDEALKLLKFFNSAN